MTRLLANLLSSPELSFRSAINHLEHINGGPSVDIRLSCQVEQATQNKLRELGLSPHDTTGPELYASLKERLYGDEQRFKARLQHSSKAIDDPVALVARTIIGLNLGKTSFGLKPTAARRLLKAQPPKRTMKLLGYRSLDSMLKHESINILFAASYLSENQLWQKRFTATFRKLKPTDFEVRRLAIEQPSSKRWQDFSSQIVAERRQYIFSVIELAAVVLLPLPDTQPPLPTLSTAALSLQACNQVMTASTYLKLQQVKPGFGQALEQLVLHEPSVSADMFQRAVPWQVIQRYYARFKNHIRSDIFEPHIQDSDLQWQSVEELLTQLEPTLEFWQGTAHLGMMHEGKAVSCNLLDAILSHCNQLPFSQRISHYFQESLWHELMLHYFNYRAVEETVLAGLQPALDLQPITA